MATKAAPVEPSPDLFASYPTVDASPDQAMSVTNAVQPGEGFTSKSMSIKAVQMSMGFDANGVHGNPGDWLVWINGQWLVMTEL